MNSAPTGKHARSYSFAFAERVGSTFATLLAQAFADICTGLSRAYVDSAHRELESFVRWLLDLRIQHSDIIARIISSLLDSLRAGTGSSYSEDLYLQLCEHYAQQFREHQPGTRHGDRRHRLVLFRWVIRQLSGRGPLPTLSRGLALPSTRRSAIQSHPPLAALTRAGVVTWKNSGQLNAALESVLRDADIPFKRLTMDQRVQALMSLNQVRLSRLRQLLEQELIAARDTFDEGQRLMNAPGLPSDDEIRKRLTLPHPGKKRPARLNWLRKQMNSDPDVGMGIVLRYYLLKGSIAEAGVPSFVFSFLTEPHVRRRFGIDPGDQLVVLQRRLAITPTAWMAAFALLLIDTAWNAAPLATLTADPFVGTIRGGLRRLSQAHVIAAFKERAGHDVHAGLLELAPADVAFVDKFGPDAILSLDASARDGISALEAVYLVQRLTAPLRVGRPLTDRLWLCTGWRGDRVSPPPYVTYRKYWTDFLERSAQDPVIGGLPITLAMIRRTRLEIDASSGAGGMAIALLRGQHVPRVSSRHYLKDAWIHHLHMEAIRVFQNALEALMARDIEGVERPLGISRNEFETRLSFAMESGLGTLVPSAAAQGFTTPIEPIRFVPRQSDIAKLHVLDLSMTANGRHLAQRSPARWEQYWYPLWLRARAVLAALETSPYARSSRALRLRATDVLH